MGRKLRFLLIYENMFKSIATARSECKAKHENKATYNTDYIVPDLIDFLNDDWKEIKTPIEKINIHNCIKYYTVLRWDIFKSIKNPFTKIKKQLILTNFIFVMYKIA